MNDLYFSLNNVLPLVWLCAVVAVLSMVWLLTVYRRRVLLKGASVRHDSVVPGGDFPPLSVIVYTCDNPIGLSALLQQVFAQEYPAKFEVIVVNDGSSEDVTDVVNRFSMEHKNLYQTFVPDEAHNLSRKKLGISLGIKAARHPFVVLTCAECSIASSVWLREMAEPFTRGKEVALGYANIAGLKGAMNRFDEAAAAVKWISVALRGKPYRGTGYNIAYSRKLFFDAKGFSKSLTLHHGDDDLFVSSIATGDNTAVVLAPGSVLSVNDHNPEGILRELRLRHCFTGRFLPKVSARFFGFSTSVMWLWLAAVVLGIVFSLPNALPASFFVLTVPLLWVPLVISWSRTASGLGIKLPRWTLPWLMLFRCGRNLRYKLRCGRASRRNYTWLQH